MPTHYGNGNKKANGKGKGKMGKSMSEKMTKQEHEMFKRAEKAGVITSKQHNNLPTPLLKAILKKKGFK
tara:strand:+ start:224 stop:430 length:207 start_codon:yes stop_codon:yes gene_type:complete